MIQYYVIGSINSDAAQAIKSHQNIEEILEITDEKYIWKIPYDQDYKGIAVVVKENAILTTTFNPSDYVESRKPMFFSPCKSVYIINCEQSKFTVVNLSRLDDYMRFELVSPQRWGESVDLAKLFNLPIGQPVFEKDEWVAHEPEPEDSFPSIHHLVPEPNFAKEDEE